VLIARGHVHGVIELQRPRVRCHRLLHQRIAARERDEHGGRGGKAQRRPGPRAPGGAGTDPAQQAILEPGRWLEPPQMRARCLAERPQ